MSRLPSIRGTQIGLRDPAKVDAIKADMRAGRFRFGDPAGQIGGILDDRGVYHVMEGHHRMAAALELLGETGDDLFVRELVRWGRWTLAPIPPMSRPLPARSWWGRFRNRTGF